MGAKRKYLYESKFIAENIKDIELGDFARLKILCHLERRNSPLGNPRQYETWYEITDLGGLDFHFSFQAICIEMERPSSYLNRFAFWFVGGRMKVDYDYSKGYSSWRDFYHREVYKHGFGTLYIPELEIRFPSMHLTYETMENQPEYNYNQLRPYKKVYMGLEYEDALVQEEMSQTVYSLLCKAGYEPHFMSFYEFDIARTEVLKTLIIENYLNILIDREVLEKAYALGWKMMWLDEIDEMVELQILQYGADLIFFRDGNKCRFIENKYWATDLQGPCGLLETGSTSRETQVTL